MRTIRLFTFPYFLFFLATGISQQLTPIVVSTSGGFYSNASGMLSFTTGEMSSVETYASPLTILTQGFQQAWDFNTSTTENAYIDFAFEIYPNPSDGEFKLITKSESNHSVTAKVVDVLGRVVKHHEFIQDGKINIQFIHLSDATQGVYFLMLDVRENNSQRENQFISKIQIVK